MQIFQFIISHVKHCGCVRAYFVKIPQQDHFSYFKHRGPRKQSSYLVGPPCSVQVRFISQSWLELPKQLDHKCTQDDCSMTAIMCVAWSRKPKKIVDALCTLSVHSPNYIFIVPVISKTHNHFWSAMHIENDTYHGWTDGQMNLCLQHSVSALRC